MRKSYLAIVPPGSAWQSRPYHFVPFHGTSGTGRSAVRWVAEWIPRCEI